MSALFLTVRCRPYLSVRTPCAGLQVNLNSSSEEVLDFPGKLYLPRSPTHTDSGETWEDKHRDRSLSHDTEIFSIHLRNANQQLVLTNELTPSTSNWSGQRSRWKTNGNAFLDQRNWNYSTKSSRRNCISVKKHPKCCCM